MSNEPRATSLTGQKLVAHGSWLESNLLELAVTAARASRHTWARSADALEKSLRSLQGRHTYHFSGVYSGRSHEEDTEDFVKAQAMLPSR
jgi:hypothetical protein